MAALDFGYPRVLPGFGSLTTPAGTSHTVTIANASNPIIAGQLLLIYASFGTSGTITWPAGWTRVVHQGAGGGADRRVTLDVCYRVADGTEGTSISVTTSVSVEMRARLFVIEGHSSSTNPPTATSTGDTSSGATSPNPPNLTLSAGKKIVFAAFAAATGTASASPFPSGYPFGTNEVSSATGNAVLLAACRRDVTALSENPGVMAYGGGSATWAAATLVVYAGTEGTITVPRILDVVTTSTSGTTHVATLPTYAVGDLLVVSASFDGTPTITWPGTLTTLCADTSASANARMGVRYRVATGSEGATVTLTTSVSEEGAIIVCAIRGHNPLRAPAGAITTGSGQATNGASVTTGVVENKLWIGGACGDGAVFFAEYHNILQEKAAGFQSSAAAGAVTNLLAYRNKKADASTITSLRFSASTQYAAWTAVIYPGSIVVPPGNQFNPRGPRRYRPYVHFLPRYRLGEKESSPARAC